MMHDGSHILYSVIVLIYLNFLYFRRLLFLLCDSRGAVMTLFSSWILGLSLLIIIMVSSISNSSIISSRNTTVFPITSIDFPQNPCPVVLGCICLNDHVTKIECLGIGPETIEQLATQYPAITLLRIRGWDGRVLNLESFNHLNYLIDLEITDGRIDSLILNSTLPRLSRLVLNSNWISDWEQICNVTRYLPALNELSLSNNHLTQLAPCVRDMVISSLKLNNNKISLVNGTFHPLLKYLDISLNRLESLDGLPPLLEKLNISFNHISSITFPDFKNILSIDISGNDFYESPSINAPFLTDLKFDYNEARMVDMSRWNLPSLKRLSLLNSRELIVLAGRLPVSVEYFSLTNSMLSAFPQEFFKGTLPISILLGGNSFDCNKCALKWILPVKNIVGNQITCDLSLRTEDNCTIGVLTTGPDIIYGPYGKKAIIPCIAYGTQQPTIQWWLFRPSTYLGSFDPITGFIEKGNGSQEILERYSVLTGGALLIHQGNRATVERYVCAVTNGHQFAYRLLKFRLDYSNWYSLDILHSVFWGGVATAILVCAFSFLLNITWILTRKSILWWIQRAERLSRVRKMVEAMEKYKTRQMESLHDKYTKRVQLVRDNYHQQVEQLRISYTSQAERFRDYRAAQMESMTSHLESIRDNYNQQMHRVREYGSKRAEQLWESYERQVNRMKAFSLQHRLKMMRQYKVKQRYLNKLLESFQDTHSPEAMRKHEEEVRAALEFPYPPDPPRDPISRSSSFYSLPEYVIGDDGVLRPSPLIPSVRFTTRDLRSPTTSSSNRWSDPTSSSQ